MNAIERKIASIREDRRAGYLFDTKVVAPATHMHANKFHARWYRTRDFLIDLAAADPGNLAAEIAVIFAEGEQRRQQQSNR